MIFLGPLTVLSISYSIIQWSKKKHRHSILEKFEWCHFVSQFLSPEHEVFLSLQHR